MWITANHRRETPEPIARGTEIAHAGVDRGNKQRGGGQNENENQNQKSDFFQRYIERRVERRKKEKRRGEREGGSYYETKKPQETTTIVPHDVKRGRTARTVMHRRMTHKQRQLSTKATKPKRTNHRSAKSLHCSKSRAFIDHSHIGILSYSTACNT